MHTLSRRAITASLISRKFRRRVFLIGVAAVFLLQSSAYGQISSPVSSDTLHLTVKKAISMAFKQNDLIKSGRYQVKADRTMEKSAFDPGNASLSYNHEEFNGHTFGKKGLQISQSIPFPVKTVRRSRLLHQRTNVSSQQLSVTKNVLKERVKQAWYRLVFLEKKTDLLAKLNHTYRHLSKVARIKYKTGETSLLNKVTAQTRQQQVTNQLNQTNDDIDIARKELQKWLNTTATVIPDTSGHFFYHKEAPKNGLSPSGNPKLNLARRKIASRKATVSFRQSQFFPNLNLAFGPQALDGQSGFYTFTVGLQFPLWFKPVKARVKSAKYQVQKAKYKYQFIKSSLSKNIQKADAKVKKEWSNVHFYRQKALKQATELSNTARQSYQTGEIDYTEYLLDIRQASKIRLSYLKAVNKYNQARIHLDYLRGE